MNHNRSHQNRRFFLKTGLSALAGAIALPRRGALKAESPQLAPKPRHCIVLYMNGGPSHIDTFDPKPGGRFGGPFSAIPTRTPGLKISEHLPQLAEMTHQMAVVRSMSSTEGNHKRARYLVHTGYPPQGSVTHPGMGSIVNGGIGGNVEELPQFVSIGSPSYGGGALGGHLDPFYVRDPGRPLEHIAPPEFIGVDRLTSRRQLLNWTRKGFARAFKDQAASHQDIYDNAIRLMSTDVSRVFDVTEEPERVRRSYGENGFGQGCLMARRLVEAGVTFVEVSLDGWDTHVDNFGRSRTLMNQLDPAFAALIQDLEMRELLDSTLILWLGEFGRTPRINADDGRDHFPGAWSAVLAGGGVRGGQVYGRTDEDGARTERPVSVADLFTTVATAFGIDPSDEYYTPGGRPMRLVDEGRVVRELLT